MTNRLLDTFWPDLAHPPELPSQTFFFEVVPSAQIQVPPRDRYGYAERERLAARIRTELVPAILRAANADPDARTQLGPGGYLGEINPSIQCHLAISDEHAQIVGAALGWVFRQKSVLVADLRDRIEGRNGYVIVDLGPGTLHPDRADAFYAHAVRVEPRIRGGFTAMNDDMLFINMTSDVDRMTDAEFESALGRAAASFESFAQVLETGIADARFISDNWADHPDGQGYEVKLAATDRVALRDARARHTELVLASFPRTPPAVVRL